MKNITNSIFGKLFPSGKDETFDYLEKMNNLFIERIRDYGFKDLKEYEISQESFRRTKYQPSAIYPVTGDC